MAERTYPLTNLVLDVAWRCRVASSRLLRSETKVPPTNESAADNRQEVRALIRRFPMWRRGRLMLANQSLEQNDIGVAYAEGQALRLLSARHPKLYIEALLVLGRCFLRRGDSKTSLQFLNEAHERAPLNHAIQEERAAAFVLDGDKTRALTILQTIPATSLSAEGKAAIQWLSSQGAQTP